MRFHPYQDILHNLKRKLKIFNFFYSFLCSRFSFSLFFISSFYSYNYSNYFLLSSSIYPFSYFIFSSSLSSLISSQSPVMQQWSKSLGRCSTSGGQLRVRALIDWYLSTRLELGLVVERRLRNPAQGGQGFTPCSFLCRWDIRRLAIRPLS